MANAKSRAAARAAPILVLPVVGRELSVAARRQKTYSTRVGVALLAMTAALGVLVWLFQVAQAEQGKMLFSVLSALAFVYALLGGVLSTADCISQEKREGTLGFLFLTDLKGYDIVLGKMAASSLASLYGLLATVPILSLATILGGVSGGELFRVALVLLNTLFVSLAAGVWASTLSRAPRKALYAGIGLILLIACGPFPVACYFAYGFGSAVVPLDTHFLLPSPIFAFGLARQPVLGGWSRLTADFMESLLATHLIGWSLLGLAVVTLPRTFQDRPAGARRVRWRELWGRWSYGNSAARKAFRTRLLDRNPFLWLAGRDRLKGNFVWLFLGLLGCLWFLMFWTEPEIILDWNISGGWLFALFSLMKVWLASEVCARLVEDRRCGALELLLATPLSVSAIVRGQGLALRRQFALPIGLICVAGVLLLWAGLRAGPHDVPTSHVTALYMAGLTVLIADLITLKWVGMWMALKSNHPNQALVAAGLAVLLAPWAIFGIWIVILSLLRGSMLFQRETESVFLIWVASWFFIAMAVDLVLGLAARRRVLHDFRSLAARRFETERGRANDSFLTRLRRDFTEWKVDRRTARRISAAPRVLRRYWWFWSLTASLAIGLAVFVWFRVSAEHKLEARLAALRMASYPLTLADLNQWHPVVLPQENAALTIQQGAMAMFVDQRLVQSLDDHERLAPELKQKLSSLLSSNFAALRLAHEAASQPNSYYPIDWSAGAGTLVPHLSQVIGLTQLLRIEALVRWDDSNPTLALDSVHAAFRLAESLSGEPYIVGQMTRLRCLELVCSILEPMLADHRLAASDLAELRNQLAKIENSSPLARALAGERALAVDAFHLPLSQAVQAAIPGVGPNEVPGLALVFGLLRQTGIQQRDALFYLDTMDQYLEAIQTPFPERIVRASEIGRRVQNQLARGPLYLLSRNALPSFSYSVAQQAERFAYFRAAATALAIEEFRLRHNGRIPETLDELIPGVLETVPTDPFDGQPLRYRRTESGYRVYSVGSNLKDDGGMEKQGRSRSARPPDLLFVVEGN